MCIRDRYMCGQSVAIAFVWSQPMTKTRFGRSTVFIQPYSWPQRQEESTLSARKNTFFNTEFRLFSDYARRKKSRKQAKIGQNRSFRVKWRISHEVRFPEHAQKAPEALTAHVSWTRLLVSPCLFYYLPDGFPVNSGTKWPWRSLFSHLHQYVDKFKSEIMLNRSYQEQPKNGIRIVV